VIEYLFIEGSPSRRIDRDWDNLDGSLSREEHRLEKPAPGQNAGQRNYISLGRHCPHASMPSLPNLRASQR